MASEEMEHGEPIADEEVAELASIIESRLPEEIEGCSVRIDAGEKGRVWFALRGESAGGEAVRALVSQLEAFFGQEDALRAGLSYRISAGMGGDDDVVFCQFVEHA